MKQHWNDKTERWEPPTNADRIRAMSGKELAKNNVRSIIVPSGYRVYTLFIASDGYQTESKEEAIKHELAWLRQPEEETK